ncbi:MAG: HDIG domain-containing protein [Prevotella sp.]|nr:HDIG domain-containing protein [Prevotella sp.]
MINFNLKTQLSWRDVAVRAAFIIVTVAAIVWFMPRDAHFNFKADIGTPWRYSDLTATFDFPVYKSDAMLTKERQEALKDFKPYYIFNEDIPRRQISLFRQHWSNTMPMMSSELKIIISNRLTSLYGQGIIDTKEPLSGDTTQQIWRVTGENASLMSVAQVLTPKQAYEQLVQQSMVLSSYEDVLKDLDLNQFIVPNLIYDSIHSQTAREELLRSVAPSSKLVQKGQRIISRGDIVDEETYQVLESFKKESETRFDSRETGLSLAGRTLYVFIFILLFTIYLAIYRKDYFDRIRSACMLYALIVIFTLLPSLLVSHSLLHVYIIPFAILPIFVRVFMDSRTAFIAHVTVILICASMLQYPMEFISVEVVGGIAVIFSLRELSSRSQLFWTAAIFTATAMAMRFSIYLIRRGDMSTFDASDYTYLVICGITVFCAYPLLYVIEKTFGFVSDITLVELSNSNKELLRRMSEEAPGTFNHSVQVGNLAAEIARKIDANAQLVRTGALYHDIGKIQNPIYYTENQSGGISPHEHLSYIESAQYIIGHVTEGLKLADKYHLPRQIRDLIATHHGQGKAKYFYIKYKNEHPDEPVDELLFTYPGPNPFTKEQAILMMADAVEAASRSLPDYTEQSIRQLVERIVDGQVQDGFFRECPITFRDIQYAKTVLIEKLKTIYHTRISYPEAKS